MAAVVLSALPAFAQDAGTPADTEASKPQPEYGGPSILSRGGGPSIGRSSEFARIRPFATISGVYDSGLATTVIGNANNVAQRDGYGIEGTFGVTGTHTWQRSSLDLDYRGSARHYTQNSYYDGIDNSLSLAYQRQMSPRWGFVLTENAARYTRAFGLPMANVYGNGYLGYNPAVSGLTANTLFDTPTDVLISSGTLIYQLSARTSISAGGSGFLLRQRSAALVGTNGYTATGDIAYRLTRYSTIGVSYSFGHFDFQHQYGQTDMHGASLNYSTRIGRHWEVGLSAGGYRVENARLIQVPLDPFIAALLGTSYGVQKFHGVAWIPNYGARITRSFRRSTATLTYDRAVLPGNGLFLTSNYQTASLGFTYSASRHLALQGGAGWSQFGAMTQTIGKYRNYSASGGFTAPISHLFSIVGRIDARRYDIQQSVLNRTYYRATLGIGITPGDFPLALW